MKILNLQRWSALVASALLVIGGFGATSALAQDEDPGEEAEEVDESELGEKAADLDRVVITGSRISRTEIAGPSPVTVIDREQLDREGFTTVSEALKSLNQVSGIVQNEAFGGFTQNANVINLRNLGPGRVLILLDGRRVADYPLPYNGQSNIVNLSAIPLAAVDRIEFLASGASAIYGSDAIAGVINIILRDDMANSLDITARYGEYVDGGGEESRIEGVGGFLGDNWNITYAFQYRDLEPTFASQRDFMDSVQDNPVPAGRINTRNVLEFDIFANQLGFSNYPVLDADQCDEFAGTGIVLSERSDPFTGTRNYCGSPTWIGEQPLQNGREEINFYTSGAFELGNHEVFGSVNYFQVDSEFRSGGSGFWFTLDPVFDVNAPPSLNALQQTFGIPGAYVQVQRLIPNAEVGGVDAFMQQYDEQVIDYTAGFRGPFFSPYWDYEVSYNRSEYELDRLRPRFVESAINDYFYDELAPASAAADPFGFGYAVVSVNQDRLYSPIDRDTFNSLTDFIDDDAESSNEVWQAVITGDVMELPAGPLALASVFEWGSQEYQINLDPRLLSADYFWGITGTGGGGERDRYAAGVELSIPVTDTLQLSVAGRYDKYDDITEVDDAFTYNLGIEYRPTDRILLRASHATSFRAPDMHFVFADPSGFFVVVDDLYLCERDEPNVPINDCTYANSNPFGQRQGNPGLEEEEGESLTVGFVVEPIDNLTISADYWEIELENIVLDESITRLLEEERDCRLGREDINSARCQEVLSRITRRPDDGSLLAERLVQIDTDPINAAFNKVNGIDAALDYSHETDGWGTFVLNLGWTHVLSDDFQEFPEDPVENVRDQSTNWRSRVRGTLTWNYENFTGTLFGERFGSNRNYLGQVLDEQAEEPRYGPQMYYNLSLGYTLLDGKADVALIINNLFDEKPPLDPNWNPWPYHDIFNYYRFTLGQSWAVQASYRFDY